MPIPDLLVAFAAAVGTDREANPRIAGDGTALELLIAPRFRTLVEAVLPALGLVPPSILPECARASIGRPDLAFARAGQPARAFNELKEPRKPLTPQHWTGHDGDQFRRFGELPLWGLSNFTAIRLAGTVALLPDRSLHMERVPERVWRFAVSGYPVLHRWLRARNGEALTGSAGVALLRAALDVAWRIEELLGLYDGADSVLARALAAPWRRADLGLGAAAPVIVEDDDAPA